MSSPRPIILCYDGSEDAKHMIAEAGDLFPGRHVVVVTAWQAFSSLGSFAWSGAMAMANFTEVDDAAAEDGSRIAAEGTRLASEAGLSAESTAVKSHGPVWEAINEAAEHFDAAIIVMGSRGLSNMRSMLLGSVSSAVVHHASRPVMIINRGQEDHADDHPRALTRAA